MIIGNDAEAANSKIVTEYPIHSDFAYLTQIYENMWLDNIIISTITAMTVRAIYRYIKYVDVARRSSSTGN